MSSKFFVLDTNVLLHNSDAITCFADNTVVLPMTVIEELDKFKKNNDELGRNARRVIRTLDGLRGQGSLGRGVPTADGGTVRFLASDRTANQLDFYSLLCSHIQTPVQTKSSSTVLPRLAATADAVVDLVNASSVARTML